MMWFFSAAYELNAAALSEFFFVPVTVALEVVPSIPSFVCIPSIFIPIVPFIINKITTKSKRAIQKFKFFNPNVAAAII